MENLLTKFIEVERFDDVRILIPTDRITMVLKTESGGAEIFCGAKESYKVKSYEAVRKQLFTFVVRTAEVLERR